MSAPGTPVVDVVERGHNRDGAPTIRIRCPHCAVRHWFTPQPTVQCPRTGHPVRISPRSLARDHGGSWYR